MTAALAGVLVVASLGGVDAVSYTPIRLVENRGERDRAVSYYIEGRDMVYFLPQGATFALRRGENQRAVVALDLVDAQRGLGPEARDRSFATVVYLDVWPGIDVSWSGTSGRMEDTFVVRPGADPRRIRLRYRAASSVRLDEDGGLAVTTPAGGFRVERPQAYRWRSAAGRARRLQPSVRRFARTGCGPLFGGKMHRSDLLVQLPQGRCCLLRQDVPSGACHAGRVRQEVPLQHVGDQRHPIQQFVAAWRPRPIPIDPLRAGLGGEFVGQAETLVLDLVGT